MNIFIKITVSEETKEEVEKSLRNNGMRLPPQINDGQVFEIDIDKLMAQMGLTLESAMWFINLQLKNFKK